MMCMYTCVCLCACVPVCLCACVPVCVFAGFSLSKYKTADSKTVAGQYQVPSSLCLYVPAYVCLSVCLQLIAYTRARADTHTHIHTGEEPLRLLQRRRPSRSGARWRQAGVSGWVGGDMGSWADLLSASQAFLRSLPRSPLPSFALPDLKHLRGMAPQVDILASDYLTRIKGNSMI
jgi:hypothetical protein